MNTLKTLMSKILTFLILFILISSISGGERKNKLTLYGETTIFLINTVGVQYELTGPYGLSGVFKTGGGVILDIGGGEPSNVIEMTMTGRKYINHLPQGVYFALGGGIYYKLEHNSGRSFPIFLVGYRKAPSRSILREVELGIDFFPPPDKSWPFLRCGVGVPFLFRKQK